ncbi:SDR family NAD(P)-dependent oxidoreductase [Kordiimonas marina]|uniref:SDR family NAD(P)-dependent oxidoreductase n=1 Tax=Kordiimonas marina TaxID=2872312 RepID=UPI001FF3AB6A|nr:SDR family NAD(P)-dependent oxidoreductase [Kordiimonas marina]MCJ9430118.1 SDR family NAD(P)-dependent oxidoreductase [Kordiimonas marina]
MSEKVCIVTGGFGFLGSHVATEAAARGYKVAVLDLSTNAPEGLSDKVGASALLKGGVDLTDLNSVTQALTEIHTHFGRIDALFNIAGGFRWETLEGGSTDTWGLLQRMNLQTALNSCKAVLPFMKAAGKGRIVNIGAAAALKAGMGMGSYAASKAGVHKLTESLAEELKGDNITVNAVLPSIIDTPTNRADMPDADFSAWVSADDLAATILFLASDEARAITGALLPVTGRV